GARGGSGALEEAATRAGSGIPASPVVCAALATAGDSRVASGGVPAAPVAAGAAVAPVVARALSATVPRAWPQRGQASGRGWPGAWAARKLQCGQAASMAAIQPCGRCLRRGVRPVSAAHAVNAHPVAVDAHLQAVEPGRIAFQQL